MKKLILSLVCILSYKFLLAGGYLLLIGGGSENDDSLAWNKTPYQWAIQKSQNKRIAIISYNSETSWLPDYFKNKCGAIAAKNFQINSTSSANLQSTYDSLMSYDVIFLKGGNQYNYYNTYRNTKTQQAVQQKFDQGGVICGTSAGLAVLSSIVYTAENSSAYSDECFDNPNNSNVTLANNFLNMFQGYVFDSHFNDRGRLGRLVAFLANWKFTQNTVIKGIGLDERTAMTIDTNRIGTVYGTGAATFLEAYNNNSFSQYGTQLRADSVKYTQLLNLNTINFNTGIANGLVSIITPQISEENRNTTIFLSGDDTQANNQLMLKEIATNGNLSDTLLIVCNSATSTNLNSFKSYLISQGVSNINILEGNQNNINNNVFNAIITNTKKVIFMENEWYILDYFFKNGTTGPKLIQKMMNEKLVLAFIGDNIRFAGKTIIENYMNSNAANTGSLILKKGLGLLRTTVFLPKVYNNSNMFVNPAAGVPYAMMKDTITNGISIDKNAFVKYYINNDKTYLKVYGNFPVMIFRNSSCKTGFANQSGSATSTTIRQIAGFDKLLLSILTNGDSLKLGNSVNYTGVVNYKNPENNFEIIVNKTNNTVCILNNDESEVLVRLIDIRGILIKQKNASSKEISIDISRLHKGIYLITIEDKNQKYLYSKKIFI